MLPKVVNKFLDSTLHKVLPSLVSAQSRPLPASVAVSDQGWQARFSLLWP